MTSRTAVAAVSISDEVTAERIVGPHAVAVAVAIVLALITGRASFLALAAPVAVVLALGVAAGRAPRLDVGFERPPPRLLEGDTWDLDLTLGWKGPAVVEFVVSMRYGHVVEGATRFAVEEVDGTSTRLRVRAERWGHHELGSVSFRIRRPGGLLVRHGQVELPGAVRVLPQASRLDSLVHPVRPVAAAGAHVARVKGPGTDFADLRPYVPGDRLRDVSWAASARSGDPWVVERHPERTGVVVLLLDGFTEVAPAGAFDRAARVVWSLARHHLANGDRVGLATTGAETRWLSPVAGRRARWLVLDALLDAGSTGDRLRTVGRGTSGGVAVGSAASSSRRRRRDVGVPSEAFVVGVTPLQSDAFVAEVVHHRRLGRPIAVVGVETDDLLEDPTDDVERAARRLWQLEAEVRRTNLSRAGVRTVMTVDDATAAVRALSRVRHRAMAGSA